MLLTQAQSELPSGPPESLAPLSHPVRSPPPSLLPFPLPSRLVGGTRARPSKSARSGLQRRVRAAGDRRGFRSPSHTDRSTVQQSTEPASVRGSNTHGGQVALGLGTGSGRVGSAIHDPEPPPVKCGFSSQNGRGEVSGSVCTEHALAHQVSLLRAPSARGHVT